MFSIPPRRYPHLYHHVLGNLPNKYPVMAYGSGASFEAHLPNTANGVVSSLSDVDYITDSIFIDELSCDIKAEIDRWSRTHRVTIGNVSVRSSHAINNLWPNKLCDEGGLCIDYNKYVVFWTMIGMIELVALVNRNYHIPKKVSSYAAVKFFFSLARNLLHQTNIDLSTYHSLTQALTGICPSNSLTTALQIKIGIASELNVDDLRQLFSPDFYMLINDVISSYSARELIISTCHLVSRWCIDPFQIRIQDYLSIGTSYVQDDFQLEALNRAMTKLVKSDAHF